MLTNKYLNNKIKKKIINIFIPMLFGFKNNKLTKTFYYENMYYKIFYLIFNHISLIKFFFKDKKIFYNFSKYFQTNLYIYLIKKKSIILNLFFHFFYVLFLTFENLEDIYTNQIFFKGYKHRLKYKTFFKKWIKPDHNILFYFKQRINTISLYILNFNIYKNFYFSKYNLFLIHTKLIYKLFYYFKMLQYKLQSFIILYKPLCKFEKKTRLMFAKINCIIYKNLNNKLINFFSLYKISLKKKLSNSSLNLISSTVSLAKKNKFLKKINIKPIYSQKNLKDKLIKKKKKIKKKFIQKIERELINMYKNKQKRKITKKNNNKKIVRRKNNNKKIVRRRNNNRKIVRRKNNNKKIVRRRNNNRKIIKRKIIKKKIIKKKIIKKKKKNNELINKSREFSKLKYLKLMGFFLAKHIFTYLFNIKFDFLYFNIFYDSLLKINWLKKNFSKSHLYYKKLFNDFLIQFLVKYSISTKLLRRYDFYRYDNNITFSIIKRKFVKKLKNIIKKFIIKFFNLTNIIKKARGNFISFIMKQMKFDLLLITIFKCRPVKLSSFYFILFNIFDRFLNKNFNTQQFYFDLLDTNEKAKKTYFFAKQFSFYDEKAILKDKYYKLFRKIEFKEFLSICFNRKNKFLNNLMRNKFSNYLFSINELSKAPYDHITYDNLYNNFDPINKYSELQVNKFYFQKVQEIKKDKFSFIRLHKILLQKKKKKYLLNILTKKLNKNIIKLDFNKLNNLYLFFIKQKKNNNLINQNFLHKNLFLKKRFLFFYNNMKKQKSVLYVLKKNKKKIKKKNLLFTDLTKEEQKKFSFLKKYEQELLLLKMQNNQIAQDLSINKLILTKGLLYKINENKQKIFDLKKRIICIISKNKKLKLNLQKFNFNKIKKKFKIFFEKKKKLFKFNKKLVNIIKAKKIKKKFHYIYYIDDNKNKKFNKFNKKKNNKIQFINKKDSSIKKYKKTYKKNIIMKYMTKNIEKYKKKYKKKYINKNIIRYVNRNIKKSLELYNYYNDNDNDNYHYHKQNNINKKKKIKKKVTKKKKIIKKKKLNEKEKVNKTKFISRRNFRQRLNLLKLQKKKDFYNFLKYNKTFSKENIDLMTKIKQQIIKQTPNVGVYKFFFAKKNFKFFTNLKFFKTKKDKKKFLLEWKLYNKFNFNFIKETIRQEYVNFFFNSYKKFKLKTRIDKIIKSIKRKKFIHKRRNKFNKFNKFNKIIINLPNNKILKLNLKKKKFIQFNIKKSRFNKKKNKKKKIIYNKQKEFYMKKKAIDHAYNKYNEKEQILLQKTKNSKLITLKKKIKKSSLAFSPFQFYINNLQLLNTKIIKLKKLNFLKKKDKLKTINKQKIILFDILNNYIKNLRQIYKNLKIKYLNIKNKIKLVQINLTDFNLLQINTLKQKLNYLKFNINKIINIFNKIFNNFKFTFKLNKNNLKKNDFIIKKNSFNKKPFLIKNKFFKNKAFKLNKGGLNNQVINIHSKNFKNTLHGQKYKTFYKSAYFKKLINYSKHYAKFLQIQKKLNKEIIFKINPFLLDDAFYTFSELIKKKKIIKQKFKSLKTIKKKKIQIINKKRKKILIKYNEKLIALNFKICQITKQNLNLNNLKLSLQNIINLKKNNNNKLLKLYIIKSKISKLKKIKLKKIKLKKLQLKKLKLKNIKIKKSNFIKLIKKKILKLIILIEKRKNLFFNLKKTNKIILIKNNIIKLRKLKLKLKKLKVKLIKKNLKKLKTYQLILKKKNIRLNKINLKKLKLNNQKINQVTEKALKKLYLANKLANEKFLKEDLKEMKRIQDLKKKENERFFKINLKKKSTTFDPKVSFKQLQRRHIYRVQKYYKDRQKRLELDRKQRKKIKIPRKKKKKYYFSQQQKFIYEKVKQYKLFSLHKYIYFFNLLLKTRLNLFKNKKNKNFFNFLFLNKLKSLIKKILFKNKSSYYNNIVKYSFDGMNFYNEYKLWYLHFKKLKKIPFNLIRLYSKFYFNKLLYNLKIKSNFYFYYYNYLKARTKVKYFKNKQLKKSFKKQRIKRLAQIMFYKLFKFYMNYFIASKNVIFSLMRNSSFYMYYKLYEISRHKIKKNTTVLSFLTNLKKKRSFYVSKSTCYSNFFFIYWAKKIYGYKVYGNYKHLFDEFNIIKYYFKFLKSKTFFFNYLINFVFLYIQKININILNYVFILNQYKTKLVINLNQFFKYLILFYFKRDQYLNFFSLKETENIIMPRYFSFFSLFFKELSIELSNWYSLVNNSYLNNYQSTFLFNLCFINHNTNAVYLHYKYKYLYYYRVYNFYIFYIFYYLYNHLFKVYKKLKLKSFKLSYDLIKYNEYNRYYLGLRTRMLILTIRNRYKRGFTVEKIFKNLKFFLRESMKKKELAGYYISIRGRYKRSSRSNKLIMKKGVYSFNKIDLKIDSSYGTLNTKYGIAGIKVIFAFK